jgi:pyridoxamine 5'-phosphate oxidase family protein
MLDAAHLDYLTDHDRGRLATVAADGSPQNKPVGYCFNPGLGTIDIAGFDMERSAKYRNVAVHPEVSFVVDDAIGEGAAGMRFVEVRGQAAQVSAGPASIGAEEVSGKIIRIHPRRVVSWNVGEGTARFQHFDLPVETADADRPSLGLGQRATEAATAAVTQLVEELQVGLDSRGPDLYNRQSAQQIT